MERWRDGNVGVAVSDVADYRVDNNIRVANSMDFKKRLALEALPERDTVQAIAARHEVHPNQVSAWKRQTVEGLEEVFSQPGSSRGGEHEATIRDLHAKIGELTVERVFRAGATRSMDISRGMYLGEDGYTVTILSAGDAAVHRAAGGRSGS